MNIKGELSSQQIVVIVLAIVGFVIAALFLFGVFQSGDLSERETCRLSILQKAALPSAVAHTLSIQCTTEKICLTAKKGFFERFKSTGNIIGVKKNSACKQFAGEENFRDVNVEISDKTAVQVKALKIIQSEIANAMYDCWTMTGQGKLDVFGGDGTPFAQLVSDVVDAGVTLKQYNPKCIICSRVAFSEELLKQNDALKEAGSSDVLSKINMNTYLAQEYVPRSELTYMQTFTNDGVYTNSGGFEVEFKPSSEKSSKYTDEIAVNFMQIKTDFSPEQVGEQWGTIRGVQSGAVTGATGAALGWVAGASMAAAAAGGATVGAKAGAMVGTAVLPVVGTFIGLIVGAGVGYLAGDFMGSSEGEELAEQRQKVSAGVCSLFGIDEDKASVGCTTIGLYDWKNLEALNDLCWGGVYGNL